LHKKKDEEIPNLRLKRTANVIPTYLRTSIYLLLNVKAGDIIYQKIKNF